jgi:flagellar biosynthesis/type III secretory pathway M-ring protein FliF/YscJ
MRFLCPDREKRLHLIFFYGTMKREKRKGADNMEQNSETIQLLRQIEESSRRSATYSVLEMDFNNETSELLKQIEKNSRRSATFSMIQMAFMAVAALCSVAVLVMVLMLVPQLDGILSQAENAMTNLEQVSEELNAVDLEGMIKDLDALLVSGQEALDMTKEKLDIVDIEKINQAITDLAKIMDPLVRLFGR